DPPALGLRERPRFHDTHDVADLGGVLLVVRDDLLGPRRLLAVERVRDLALEAHDDGLVHPIADYRARARLAPAAVLHHIDHQRSTFAFAARRSASTIFSGAVVRRAFRRSMGFASTSVPALKRRPCRSCSSSAILAESSVSVISRIWPR